MEDAINVSRPPPQHLGDEPMHMNAPRCPFIAGQPFDPLNPEQAGRPYPWLTEARKATPVFYMPGYNLWCVTRYEDVVSILKDPSTYSSRKVINFTQVPAEFESAFSAGRPDRVLVTLDPPEHTRLRKLAQRAFSTRLVAAQEPEIRALVTDLIDGFIERGGCDLVEAFANRLPVQVITRLVGAPKEKSTEFKQWADDRLAMLQGAPTLSPKAKQELLARAVAFSKWLREFIEERHSTPRSDFATALLQSTTDDGERSLTLNEIVSMISTVLSAGSTSTSHFLPLLVRELLRHPEQWNALKANRALIPQAIEEAFRYITTVHGILRTTNREVEIAGVRIPAGADIYLNYASAQRDETVFTDAEVFDIHRPRLHLQIAFGRYTHLCLGAPLARLEARITLECFLERLPNLRLVEPQEERYIPNLLSPGLEHLLVEW